MLRHQVFNFNCFSCLTLSVPRRPVRVLGVCPIKTCPIARNTLNKCYPTPRVLGVQVFSGCLIRKKNKMLKHQFFILIVLGISH